MPNPEMGGYAPETSESELAAGISERANTASEKIQSRVHETFLPNIQKLGSMAESWLSGIQSDFHNLAQDPEDESGGGKYADWTPDEIKELYSVLYGEELEDE